MRGVKSKKFSDAATTIKELKNHAWEFQRERGWDPPTRSLAISIAIEAAELLEYFQWDDYAQKPNRNDGAIEELADVMIYCLQFASREGIDIAKAVKKKMEHNEKKYPAHLFKSNSKKEIKKYYEIKKAHRSNKAK